MDRVLGRSSWEPCAIEPPAFEFDDEDEGEGERETPPLAEEQLVELVELAVGCTPRRLLSRFQELALIDDLSLDEVLFDRIRPVADRLGQCWKDDRLDFGQVTVGAAALQRVVAAFGYEAEGPLLHRELVVLTAAPGEQHVLPIHLLSEAIRAEGWATHVEAQMDLEDLLDLVSLEEVAMVAITCKEPDRLAQLAGHAEALREASRVPLELALGGAPELEECARDIGFTYYSSGRAFCRGLAPGGGL